MIRKLLGFIFLIGAIGIPLSMAGSEYWILGIAVGIFYLVVSIMFFAYSSMHGKKWWQKTIYVIVCLALVVVLAPTCLIVGGVEGYAKKEGIPSSELYSQLFDDFKMDVNKDNSKK